MWRMRLSKRFWKRIFLCTTAEGIWDEGCHKLRMPPKFGTLWAASGVERAVCAPLQALLDMSSEERVAEQTLYILDGGENIVLFVDFVNGIALIVNVQDAVADIIKKLNKKHNILVLQRIDRVLGITLKYSGEEIKLHYQPIVKCVLKVFSMEHCRPVATPLPARQHLIWDDVQSLRSQFHTTSS